jgi:uncharacterized protein (TIGR02996 family)
MSATLRHDMGQQLYDAFSEVLLVLPEGLPGPHIEARLRNNRWDCMSFALKLPTQLAMAVDVLAILTELHFAHSLAVVASGAKILAAKIYTSLGLPFRAEDDECGFLAKILDTPEEQTNWLVYADWLQDKDDADAALRCQQIRQILAKKATRVKYGIVQMCPEWDNDHRYMDFDWPPRVAELLLSRHPEIVAWRNS